MFECVHFLKLNSVCIWQAGLTFVCSQHILCVYPFTNNIERDEEFPNLGHCCLLLTVSALTAVGIFSNHNRNCPLFTIKCDMSIFG